MSSWSGGSCQSVFVISALRRPDNVIVIKHMSAVYGVVSMVMFVDLLVRTRKEYRG